MNLYSYNKNDAVFLISLEISHYNITLACSFLIAGIKNPELISGY